MPLSVKSKNLKLPTMPVMQGEYRHYMLKEIYEQPLALTRTIEGRIAKQASIRYRLLVITLLSS